MKFLFKIAKALGFLAVIVAVEAGAALSLLTHLNILEWH